MVLGQFRSLLAAREFFSFFLLISVCVLIASAALAWSGPTATAPGGNVAAPINVGTTDQVKDAGISVNSLAVFGSQYIQSKLGIGRESPVVPLDVNGTIRIANSGEVCQPVTEGAVRYNSTSKELELCDGTSWGSIGGGGGAAHTETYTNIGNSTFSVPGSYSSISCYVQGGGGGGGGSGTAQWAGCGGACSGGSGGSGGQSKFNSSTPVVSSGGAGGGGGQASDCTHAGATGAAGAAGTASGGDTNTTGGGMSGGTGGVGGGSYCYSHGSGGTGGAGAKSVKTWTSGSAGAPTPGSSITITVGAAGGAGSGGFDGASYSGNPGTAGTAGSVVVTWTE